MEGVCSISQYCIAGKIRGKNILQSTQDVHYYIVTIYPLVDPLTTPGVVLNLRILS